MPFLFIGTTGDQAGQSLLAWTVARRLSEKGLDVGFFKPRSTSLIPRNGLWADPDACLFKEVLNLQGSFEEICPGPVLEQAISGKNDKKALEKIKSLATEAAIGKDVVLILGSKHIFFDDVTDSLADVAIISELNADLVLIHRFKKTSTTFYSLLSIISLLKKRVKAIVINRVPAEQISDLKNQVIPFITQKGAPYIVILPEDPFLSFRNVGTINQIVGGQIICGEEFLDRRVVGMTVGTGFLKEELRIFKKVYNKIILLGPEDNGQVVAGVILTGDRKPVDPVLNAAKKSDIPLILVKEDTFLVKERLDHASPALTPLDESKVLYITAMLDRDNSLNEIIQLLGLDSA